MRSTSIDMDQSHRRVSQSKLWNNTGGGVVLMQHVVLGLSYQLLREIVNKNIALKEAHCFQKNVLLWEKSNERRLALCLDFY